jgi:hypothetical protein
MTNAVFLEDIRCDGRSYGGCEMECLIFWKEAWLTRVNDKKQGDHLSESISDGQLVQMATARVRRSEAEDNTKPVYSCQATEMPNATTRMSIWNPRQYVEDWTSGNAKLCEILSALSFLVYDTLASSGMGIGSVMRAAYERAQRSRSRMSYPARRGKLRRNARTPTVTLGLKPGDTVRVKDHPTILSTVTEDLVNRGMAFHPDMVPYCSQTFRVGKSVGRIINEKTGQLIELRNPCIVLEGASCRGRFTKPLLCPRGMSPYWREIWLDPVDPAADQSSQCGGQEDISDRRP